MGFGSIVGSVVGGALGLLGGKQANNQAQDNFYLNSALQKEFAQNGIRWKVDDAKAAGIHPLAALGSQTASFPPISIDGSGVGSAIANFGQDISRSVTAAASQGERLQQRLLSAQIEGQEIENAYRASQLSRLTRSAQQGPAMPVAGVDQSDPLVKDDVMKRIVSSPTAPHSEPGPF